MESSCLFLAFVLVLKLMSSTKHLLATSLVTDENALLALKNTITSDPHGILANNWFRNSSVCSWAGVTCGNNHQRVIVLDFSGYDLGGTLPPHLGNLTFLRHFDMSVNNLTGEIPSEIGSLSMLRELSLGYNNFVGELPQELGNLAFLKVLDVRNNSLSGPIPSFIFNISTLESLELSSNRFSGEIPQEIGNLINLEMIYLSKNNLRGSIPQGELPQELGNLAFLKVLDVSNNFLSGPIPSSIFNISTMVFLELSYNQFSGEIPQEIGNLINLGMIYLSKNNLRGSIPQGLLNISTLRTLALGDNQLTGTLPTDLGYKLPNLVSLLLDGNNFTSDSNSKFSSFITSLTNCRHLQDLSVSNNPLINGILPASIGNLSSLVFLDASDCNLTGRIPEDFGNFKGEIPQEVGNLINLGYIYLSKNNLRGSIPQGLLNISTLEELILMDNQLTGTLPADLGYKLPNLESLLLNGNNFTCDSNSEFSSFITSLTNCRSLQFLSVANNPLINGILPASIGNLSTSLQYINVNNCNLTSIIPEEIGNLSQVYYLLLHSNRLTGHIPSSICNLKKITHLHVSNNILEGPIPECLTANLTRSLLALHLKGNRLNGSIPTTFARGCILEYLNLDGNNLDGTLPRSMSECRKLQVIDVGNNGIQDEFPFWVETLPNLRVFVLKSNKFHGPILHSSMTNDLNNRIHFPKLQVFDISRNAFTGFLSSAYLNNFRAMINVKDNTQTRDDTYWFTSYEEPIVFVLKGLELTVERIFKTFTTIDLSCNKFNGSIPQSIGGLNSLRYLNLSHNSFTGIIPASLGNAKSIIESLDLSSNQLVGRIPWSLTRLPSLSKLNLSRNNLVGRIPQTNSGQIHTFDNSSYMENSGLCGSPLTKKCEEDNSQPSIQMSPRQDDDGSGFIDGFCWQVVVLGYGCGFILGVITGCVIFQHERTKCLSSLFFTARYRKKPNRGGNLVRRRT